MALLYDQQGATKAKNPVFFAIMSFSKDTQPIF